MPPHHPANDAAQMTTAEQFKISVMRELEQHPMAICWDEAAACLARHDYAGCDAALRIFRKLEKAK